MTGTLQRNAAAGRNAVLAGNRRANIDPLEAAVRADDERSKRHCENGHKQCDDGAATDQDSHIHFPSWFNGRSFATVRLNRP